MAFALSKDCFTYSKVLERSGAEDSSGREAAEDKVNEMHGEENEKRRLSHKPKGYN